MWHAQIFHTSAKGSALDAQRSKHQMEEAGGDYRKKPKLQCNSLITQERLHACDVNTANPPVEQGRETQGRMDQNSTSSPTTVKCCLRP